MAGALGRGPSQAPSPTISSRASAAVRNPMSMPSSSARVCSTRRSAAELEVRAGSKDRSLPSQSVNEPAFSVTGATGNTMSARAVTADSRNSRLMTHPVASMAARASSGSARSAGSIPAISRTSRSPWAAADRMAVLSRPGWAGRSPTFQMSLSWRRAAGSVTGRPPGSRFGRHPASSAPRSPARRGIHASDAPVASARRAAADSAPGLVARRSPTRMIAPGWVSNASVASASSAAASPPGVVGMTRALSLVDPREANGAMVITGSACWRTALRSRRKTMGDSSSGSNPASTTTGAVSRSP